MVDHIRDLIPDPRNARQHTPRNVGMIRDALHEVGAARSIVIDEGNVILAGNATVDAAAQAGIERVRIVDADGDEIIAVRRSNLTPEQKTRLALFDNRAAELAEWDSAQLAELAQETDLSGLFRDDELDALIAGLVGNEGNGDPDAVPEAPAEPTTQLGDLWRLGAHRLLCGDANDEDARAHLWDGPAPGTLVFDPSWDAQQVPPSGPWSSTLAFGDGQTAGDVVRLFGSPTWVFVWDCVASWYVPHRPLRRIKLCLWYGDINAYDFDGSHYGEAGPAHDATNSRGTYRYQPDSRGKHLSDLFALSLPQFHADAEHAHAKPVDWVRCLLANCTDGDVFDPYLGSATTLIACEQLDRSCLGMEIDAAMCDVAVARWEAFTGRSAERLPAAQAERSVG